MKDIVLFLKSDNPAFKWAKTIFGLAVFAGLMVLLSAIYCRHFISALPAQASLSYYNIKLGILEEISIFYLMISVFTFGIMIGIKITEKE